MQHLPDDIDQIVKEAAEGYPLRSTPDWQKVQFKLIALDEAGASAYYQRGNFLPRLAVVLLLGLIPLGTVVNRLVFNDTIAKTTAGKSSLPVKKETAGTPESVMRPITSTGTATVAINGPDNININHPIINDISTAVTAVHNQQYQLLPAPENSSFLSRVTNSSIPQNFAGHVWQQLNIKAGKHDPPASVVDEKNKTTGNTLTTRLRIKPIERQKSFYLGAIVSSELTSVRGQSFRKPGYNGGFVMGYNINKRFQFEAGAVLAHKYFYSDGKYAAPNSLRKDESAIGGMNIFSSITEIPVVVRYNITNNGRSKIFGAAGAVSSIVHREKYNFEYTKNGENKKGYRSFNKSNENVFSNLQLSAGYEKSVGSLGMLRVEPYYRLPLNGVGAGDLPVTSLGINFGFIKYIK